MPEPFRDEKTVQYWTDALHQEMAAYRRARRAQLLRLILLPALRASDAAHITQDGMSALISLLHGADYALAIAVLKALQQVGDARAIPAVQSLEMVSVSPTHLRSRWLQISNGQWLGSWGEV